MASTVSGTSSTNNVTRATGLVSGLDVDSLVKAEMSDDLGNLDKIKQNEQTLTWKQTDYRTMISSMQDFSNTYFDVTNPTSNFMSTTAFVSNTVSSSNSAVLTATTMANAETGSHSIQIASIATAAKITGSGQLTGNIEAGSSPTSLNLKGKQIAVTIDGVTNSIDLDNYSDLSDLKDKLGKALDKAFGTVGGSSKVNVDVSSGKVALQLNSSMKGSTLNVSESTSTFLTNLGFSNGKANYIAGSKTYSDGTGGLPATDLTSYSGGKFKITSGGTTHEITLGSYDSSTDINTFMNDIQSKIDSVDGGVMSGKINVTSEAVTGGSKLDFTSVSGDQISFSNGSSNDVLAKLGISSGTGVSGTASSNVDLSGDETGKSLTINIDGTDKTIQLNQDFSDIGSLVSYLNNSDNTLSSNGVTAGVDSTGQKLVFSSSSKLIVKSSVQDGLASLGFAATDNKSNKTSLSSSLYSLRNSFSTPLNGGTDFDKSQEVQVTLNGVAIDVGKTYDNATVADVMSAINSSTASVKMTYDPLSDNFTLSTKGIGSNQSITVGDSPQGLMASLGISGGTGTTATGTDASFKLDSMDMIRSTNDFTINGVNYSLKSPSPTAETETVSITPDVDTLFDKIKAFVDKYNTMISTINTKVEEKPNSGYPPLTDDQRASMNETDINNWETQAKAGMLYQDGILSSAVERMRSSLFDSIYTDASNPSSKLDYNLTSIGITTGTWDQEGKLVIDETKLRNAISSNPDEISNLFTKQSSVSYNDAMKSTTLAAQRSKESGLAQRLNDILQDNIRTTRDLGGHKGALIEVAGVAGDGSEYTNSLSSQLGEATTDYNTLLDQINSKEDSLYQKYSTLETTLSGLQSQSSWLSSQFK